MAGSSGIRYWASDPAGAFRILRRANVISSFLPVNFVSKQNIEQPGIAAYPSLSVSEKCPKDNYYLLKTLNVRPGRINHHDTTYIPA